MLEYSLAAPRKPEATDFDVSSFTTVERFQTGPVADG